MNRRKGYIVGLLVALIALMSVVFGAYAGATFFDTDTPDPGPHPTISDTWIWDGAVILTGNDQHVCIGFFGGNAPAANMYCPPDSIIGAGTYSCTIPFEGVGTATHWFYLTGPNSSCDANGESWTPHPSAPFQAVSAVALDSFLAQSNRLALLPAILAGIFGTTAVIITLLLIVRSRGAKAGD